MRDVKNSLKKIILIIYDSIRENRKCIILPDTLEGSIIVSFYETDKMYKIISKSFVDGLEIDL